MTHFRKKRGLFLTGVLLALVALATGASPQPAAAQSAASPAFEGDLEPTALALDDLSAFESPQDHWQIVGRARASRTERRVLHTEPGTGVLAGLPTEDTKGHEANLYTAFEHGDLFLEMDVMMPKGSNSGIYLMGRYEVQLLDSWGVDNSSSHDMGAIYQRWDPDRPEGEKGYQGHPPRVNVARAPGLWQHLEIAFEAPEFNAQGKKTKNARLAEVRLNGVVIHKNVTLRGPTRGGYRTDEVARAPLMIQGDHGPVALRNIRYKRYEDARVQLSNVQYRYFDVDRFDETPSLDTLETTQAGAADVLGQQVVDDNNTFVLELTGTMRVPKAGPYRFDVQNRGEAVLSVDGERVVRQVAEADERPLPSASGRVPLEAGTHDFRLLYAKSYSFRRARLALFAIGPGMPRQELTAPRSAPSREESVDPIFVEAGEQPYVLRSFLWQSEDRERKYTHAASVGTPTGTHYAMDVAQGTLLRVWKGGFANATRMWKGRGNAQVAVPRGSVLHLAEGPPVAALSSPEAPWPDSLARFRYQGYRLDDDGHPVFRYRAAGMNVEDHLRPIQDGRVLARTMTVRDASGEESGSGRDEDARRFVRLAAADQIERLSDGSYAIGDFTYYVDLADAAGSPKLRTAPDDGRDELLLPLRLGSETEPMQVSYQIVW